MALSHVTICVCTFRRPDSVARTLRHLQDLETSGLFDYSIVVVDNDRMESARATVEEIAGSSTVRIVYCVEPEQNISLARNRALANATGDYVAWIDDDEFPPRDWLIEYYRAMQKYGGDGILGPVKPVFETPPPAWILKGRFFEKPRRPSGTKLRWQQTSTANVFMRRTAVDNVEGPFRKEYGGGCEDLDLFRRLISAGGIFYWCDEALVSEVIPPVRWTRKYLLRRALLRGQNGCRFSDFTSNAKSVVAIPLYILMLPLLLAAGQHLFVLYLMKLWEHTGKLLGLLGLRVIGNKYVAG
jgi:succinoglycan biosynthesis protein ExoM